MKFIEGLKWLEIFDDESAYVLKNIKTDHVISSKSLSGGMIFEINHPDTQSIYNKDNNFVIIKNNIKVLVNNFLVNNGNHLLQRLLDAYIFQSENFDANNDFYYRLLSPIKSAFYLLNLLEYSDKNKYEFDVDGILFEISIKDSDKRKYLIVETKSKIAFSEFKHLANSVLFSLGYLNGELIKGEELYFQTVDQAWEGEIEFFYRRLNKSVISYKPITSNPKDYSNFIDVKDYDFDTKKSQFTTNQLEKLIYQLKNNSSFFTATRILLETFNNSFINRPSVLFVSLEIIVDEILKIKSRLHSEKYKIKEISIEVLNKYRNEITSEDFDLLTSSLDEIDKNLSQNNKRYESAFKNLDIELSIEERKCLNKRNKFFHGRLVPFSMEINNEEDYTNLELEYHYLSQRLFSLISKLILKNIGYNGYIINHVKLRDHLNREVLIKEDYFIKI